MQICGSSSLDLLWSPCSFEFLRDSRLLELLWGSSSYGILDNWCKYAVLVPVELLWSPCSFELLGGSISLVLLRASSSYGIMHHIESQRHSN